MMGVADANVTRILTGTGDVLEPADGIAAIGSGGNYALSAARALMDYEEDAEKIARKAMQIAADVCVYTNENVTVESLASSIQWIDVENKRKRMKIDKIKNLERKRDVKGKRE